MKEDVPGWSSNDDSLSFLPKFEDDSESESDEEIHDEQSIDNDDLEMYNRKKCVKIEVTYDVFCNSVWPKIRKGFEQYHPSLVWMEIISFIKGSYEALIHENGYLDRREYISHGKKKAPNFSGERDTIYDIFLKYCHFLKQRFWFDEADVVRNIFCRFRISFHCLQNIFKISYIISYRAITHFAERFHLILFFSDKNLQPSVQLTLMIIP